MKRVVRGIFLYVLFALSLLASIPTTAQHMNEKDSPCANVVVTVDLANCLSKAGRVSNAKLNSVYEDIRKRLISRDGERLTIAQRFWIQYRNANCSAERELYEGGTASTPAYLACLEAMTRARTKELEVTYAVTLK